VTIVPNPDEKLYAELRDTWVQGHPRHAAALLAIKNAEETAAEVQWKSSPLEFAEAHRKARKAIADAREDLAKVTLELHQQYNTELDLP
jgi:hypothetical protein